MRNVTTNRCDESNKIFQYLWPMKEILVDIAMVAGLIISMLFIENKETGTNFGLIQRALLGVLHLTNHIAVLLRGRPPSKEQVNKFSNCK